MSVTSALLNILFKLGDMKRDKGLKTPENIDRLDDLYYCETSPDSSLLDIYLPKTREKSLPVIISIHGGGWVYGNKETYQFYCMHLAQFGFAVLNFNYRLAPKNRFPAALEDINKVFHWTQKAADKMDLDIRNLFVVGDSAGAQLASQYAAILTNENYAKLFPFTAPDLKIKAMGLNCGIFDPLDRMKYAGSNPINWFLKDLLKDYLGNDFCKYEREMDFQSNINARFPAVFLANSVNDILVGTCPALLDYLERAGVHFIYREYGHNDKTNGHVFHLDIAKKEAQKLNIEQVQFFCKYIDI